MPAYTFKDFERAIEPVSEDQACKLLDIIYPERRGIRANVSPRAGSYKKRLLYNIKQYWKNVDLDKLEVLFKKLNLSIYRQNH